MSCHWPDLIRFPHHTRHKYILFVYALTESIEIK